MELRLQRPLAEAERPAASAVADDRPDRRPLARESRLVRPAIVLGLVAMAVYWAFRLSTFFVGQSFWPTNLLLFIGETVAILAQLALIVDGWSLPPFKPPVGTRRPAVDILVPVYNEPIEVLRPTLSGCLGQDYEGPMDVWLLDDGRRPELAELAGQLGVHYLTREDNRGAKAGNINHALGHLSGELVSVLDCDMVPQPDYISAVVPYFEDDRVALVQTPHGFYNTDSFQHYSASRHDQSLFYDVLQRGKDGHNSAYWCGTGGLLRTEALRQVGGVAEDTITEDFHTSVRLHARGWRSRYHPVALTFGLGATDHGTYAGQRDRWGSGNIALLRTSDSPLTVPGLTLRQRISYLATLVAVLAGLRRLCFVIGVALILATARIPFSADPRVLVVLLGTSLVTGTVAVLALGRGRMAVGDLSRGEILALPAQLSALRTLVLGDRGSGVFTVTAKDATVEHWSAFVRSNRALTVLTALLATGVVIGVGRQVTGNGLQTAAALLTFVLAGWEATQLGLAWRFGLRYHQRRTAYRVPVEGRRALIEDGERVVIGRLVDLSPAGAGIEVFDDLEAEVGDVVPFAIDGVPTPVLASICRIAGGDVGLAFEHVPAESGIVIDRVCYVDSITAADVVPEETELDRSSAQPETGSTEPAEPAEAEPGWPPLRSETWDALRRLAGPPASGPGQRPDGPAETHDRSAVVASRPPGRSAEAGGGSS